MARSQIEEEEKTSQLLMKGLLELYEPALTAINTHLKELATQQDSVHNMLSAERRKLMNVQNDATLDAMLADIATNRENLVSLTTNMMSLHKKMQSLQARAKNIEKAAKNKSANSSPSKTATS